MGNMEIKLSDFRKLGAESRFRYNNLFVKWFIRKFGPLGINIKIRSGHVLMMLSRVKVIEDASVLDAGCGQAYIDFWLAKNNPKWKITAVDTDRDMVGQNNNIVGALYLKNLNFVELGLNELKYSNQFDVVICMDVLEHVDDDNDALQRIYTSLKNSGILILHVPIRYSHCFRIFPGFRDFYTIDHVRDEYTIEEITEKLRCSGFRNIDVGFTYSRWGELAFELNYLFWKHPIVRMFFAFITHPLVIIFGYKDLITDPLKGNGLIIKCEK